MVVVVIIGVLATIAVPSLAERFRERRSAEYAQKIVQIYRQARLRAMGRGACVLVRYQNGRFDAYEAIIGGSGNCAKLPSAVCTPRDWGNATTRNLFTSLTLEKRGEYSGVKVTSAATNLDIAFTPLGQAFENTGFTAQMQPMIGVRTFEVSRTSGGIPRTVTVLPNGVARLSL